MNNKIFNKVLSLLVAISILAISLFTGGVISSADTTTDTWDGTYTQPTTTDVSGNIIISTAEELAWVILQSGDSSADVTYKVADGVSAFYMNENTADLTLEQVKNTLNGNNVNTWDYQSNAFQGMLDGNGVTVYGLYSKGENNTASGISALIPYITGTVVVKNLAVKNSYISGYKYAAAIIGSTIGNEDLASLTIENCEVSNNYIYQTRTSSTTSGVNYSASAICGSIGARAVPCYVTINNCAVYENELYSALGGNLSGTIAYFYPKSDNAANGYFKFTNLLISGVAPWCGNHSYHGRRDINFENVYTDTDASDFVEETGNVSGLISSAPCSFIEGKITLVDTNNMKGTAAETNMSALDWTDTWVTTDGFATLKLFYNAPADDGGDTPSQNITDTWDGTYIEPTTTDDSGNVIINTAEELAWAILKSGDASAGETYRVADGISAFYMNENTADLTLDQVKNNLNGNNSNVWEYQGNYFQGSLDGNGVTVYGLYSSGASSTGSNDGGLIPYASGDVTIKNICVKNSYIGGYKYSSAIVTYTTDSLTSLTIQQCVVTNNYITQTRSTQSSGGSNYGVGAIGGYIGAATDNCSVTVDNCLVYENELYSTSSSNNSGTFAQLMAVSSNTSAGLYQFSNLVISGAAPWSANYSYYARLITNFANVYTDTDASEFTFNSYLTNQYPDGSPDDWCTFKEGSIELIDTANMQGSAANTYMPNLAWDDVWKTGDTFPILTIFDRSEESGDEEEQLNIIYWDGTSTAPDESKTDEDGNILIHNAAELHYIAIKLGTENSTGKTYKIADGIDVIILQPEGSVDAETLMGLTDYNAVKTYLTETVSEPKNWLDGVSDSVRFNGSFDGNGVEIYGLYATGASVGLFPCGDGGTVYTTEGHTGCVYQNFAVRNSYLESTRRLGVIAAYCASGMGIGTVTAKNCEVSNCYIISTATTASYFGEAGVLIGRTSNELVKVDNCLVYGNYSYATGLEKQIPLYPCAYTGDSSALNTVENSIVLGTVPYPTYSTSSKTHSVDSFENVYTDRDLPTYTTYADTDIKKIDTSAILGINAKSEMPNLAWNDVWVAVEGKIPALSSFYNGAIIEEEPGGNEPEEPEIPDENAWDGTAATSYAGGDGSQNNPFIIETISQLFKMVNDNGEDSSGNAAYFKVKDGVYDLYANNVENMTSAEIKTYFADTTKTKISWDPQSTEFNGHFDGNGVNIHGLYNVKNASGTGVAFLPRVSNSTVVIENVEFSDCYFENTATTYSFYTSAAILVARGDSSTINFNNVAVYDSTAICLQGAASVFVASNGSVVTIDTAFTSGNVLDSDHYYSETLTYPYEGILYGDTTNKLYTIKNSIFTETDEYLTRYHYNISVLFENTYTAGKTASEATKIDIPILSQSSMQGESAQTNMPDLDWSAWIVTDSYPVIAALHDITYTNTGDNGHSVACGDCDLSIALESHNYNSDYVCTLCAFQHSHTLVDTGIDYDSTCTDSGVMNVKCDFCDYVSTREICAKNHTFGDVIDATAGDCQTEATVAHKICSVCELAFSPDQDNTSKNPLDHIGTGYTGRHDWVEQESLTSECGGVNPIPYFQCSVCNTYLVEGVMCNTAPSEIDGHTASGNYYIDENIHANICVTCGEHFSEQAHTDANSNSICDICGWPCGEHVFDGASITLTDSIAVNYMVKKSVMDVLGYENLYIEFIFRGKNYIVSEYTESGEYYVFTFDKVAPHRMTDTIYANLCGTKEDATYRSQTSEYSVARYCYNMLEKCSSDEYAELRTLLVDLLNYGAEAQIYTDYNTDNLANENLTDAQKAWGTNGDVTTETHQNLKYKVVDNPSVKWKGAGLYLDEAATLRFTIQTDNIENLVVKVSCSTTTFEIPASRFVKRSGTENMYYVYVRGINVTKMREAVYLTVFDGETEVSNTICYSVESYADAQIGGSDTKLSNLLITMIKYGDSAKAYYDAQ